MYNWEKSTRGRRGRHEKQNPSFSSSLLDKIYRSIDEGEARGEELRFRRETTVKKQSKSRTVEEEEILSLRQACLLDKWMEEKSREKISVRQRNQLTAKLDREYYHRDALFFSSGSNSSESSSGGLSSSDTEYFHDTKPIKSGFLRPVRIGSEKTERRQSTLFYEQREMKLIDDHHFYSAPNQPKSKSKAMKFYGNLKNLKQPISPGGRLTSFLTSIFAGTAKKSNNPDMTSQRVSKSVQGSTCSSASSFSRSCLSKNSPASRERSRDGVKRSVRFCPVTVVVDGKEKEELKRLKVEEAARNFLQQYHQNQNKRSGYDDEDEEDDGASCASSDLFELDHLAAMGSEELPVYESTRIGWNRDISKSIHNAGRGVVGGE